MYRKAIAVIITVTFLILLELVFLYLQKRIVLSDRSAAEVEERSKIFSASLLAFGDINLGRSAGQRILQGEIDFPFEKINVRKYSADIVFANLESPLSDQNGKTVDPKNNLVFTGPPQGAESLSRAGITVVSTANNHALDFGVKALAETIENLHSQQVLHVGTSIDKEKLFQPLIIEKNKIKFAIFAITSFVNFSPKNWRNVVASLDIVTIGKYIARYRNSVDFVILSYHGGVEYANKPATTVIQFAEWCINNGVDVVLGHHPHVTYGINVVTDLSPEALTKGGKIIVHSLGNFIFNQPQHYWTQRSYGIKIRFEKTSAKRNIAIEKIIPLRVAKQTTELTDSAEVNKLIQRTQKLSNINVSQYWK